MAALLLTVALVTGLYLIFVYEIGRPYESVLAIQRDAWLGRFMRALHRYASDGALVAVALHALRMLVQGKTWGPRALAWITGVLLAGMTLLSAITGFVLVWDALGQKLAVAGARMLRLLPLFPDPPDRAFSGEGAVPSQFFFMNLFLHVAIPLGMIAFLWLHTARLARAAWFPERRVTWATVAALVGLSVVWPAPLPPAADLLAVPGRVATDWFYAFWLPLAEASPPAGLAAVAALTGALVAAPWLLRPRRTARPAPAVVDPEKCEGCRQCFTDCPYDAIEMIPGLYPDRHPERASIEADRCVSCGLCAGSCASLAIGPPSRTAWHQLAAARQLVASTPEPARVTLFVACRNNAGMIEALRARHRDAGFFEVDCAGTVHPGTVSYLAGHFHRTVVVSCPPENCLHREGALLAHARILEERRPAVVDRIRRQPVRLLQGSASEWPRLAASIEAFLSPATVAERSRLGAVARVVSATLLGAIVLALLALGSRWPQGHDADHALLRLGWRLTGQVRETCRELTAGELARRPAHMRMTRECVSTVLAYTLTAAVDGHVVARKTVRSPGLRADRPLSVEEELPVTPGDHLVKVTFAPEDPASGGRVLEVEGRARFDRGRVVLVTYDKEALAIR